MTRSLCTGLLRESKVFFILSSRGRLVVTHQESWVGWVGTEEMLVEREESLLSSALTLVTRNEGEYCDQTQLGRGLNT